MATLAVVQKAPVFLNKTATISRAVNSVTEASSKGAELVIFTEAFIPCYPAWIWRLRPGKDGRLSEQLYSRFFENALVMEYDDLSTLCESARKYNVTIVCGIVERDNKFSRATLYNTTVVIGPDGSILNRHRKLMPTNPERMVWGFGDASGLKVIDTPFGRLATLICWENYMPLARYALYSQGVEIYIAPTYDSGNAWIGTLQYISREGRCWVVGCGNLLRGSDIPDDFPDKDSIYPDKDEWINPGDSIVIAPGGDIVAGPMCKEEGILYCDVDNKLAAEAKRSLDVAGHYSRSDIFKLHVNTKEQPPVDFDSQDNKNKR